MVGLSATLAAASIASLFLPGRFWLLALALAILAIGTGLDVYRRRPRSADRLTGALASFVGATVALIATAKVVLTLAAIRHISSMLSG